MNLSREIPPSVAAAGFFIVSAGFGVHAYNSQQEWSKATEALAKEKQQILAVLDMSSRSLFDAAKDLGLKVTPPEGFGSLPFVEGKKPTPEALRLACADVGSDAAKRRACSYANDAISKIPQYESLVAGSQVPKLVELQKKAERGFILGAVGATVGGGAVLFSSLVWSLSRLYPDRKKRSEGAVGMLRAA